MTLDQQRIRELAYQLWEAAGCPEGQDLKHWNEACEQIQAKGGASPDASEETLETASGSVESGAEPSVSSKQNAA
ncbi:DUF2934 domain-containing protein [Azotobacter sp. CWF10]